MRRILLLVPLAVLASGCATNLALLQTAQTQDPGQLRLSAGAGAAVPADTLADARRLADEHKETLDRIRQGLADAPDEAGRREILRTAASLAVFPPEPVAHVGARYGVAEGFDLGFTWSTSALRGDFKWRLTPKDSPLSFALLAGAELYTFDLRIFELTDHLVEITPLFEYVSLIDPWRYDADAGAILSLQLVGVLDLYFAGRYRAGWYELPIVVTVPLQDGSELSFAETIGGMMHYGGGTVGVSLGLPFLRIVAELNVGMVQSSPLVLGERQELGGLILYPAAALALTLF